MSFLYFFFLYKVFKYLCASFSGLITPVVKVKTDFNFCYRLLVIILFPLSFAECQKSYEPRCEKTGLRGFRPGPTQTGMYSHRRWLGASNFGFRK